MLAPSKPWNISSQGRAVLRAVPTQHTIVAERFFDESGGMQLVIHAPFGGRINKAWGLALRKRFCRSFNFELQAAATDNGLNISLSDQHSFPLARRLSFPPRRQRRAAARASRAGFADFHHALALGRRARTRRCCASWAGKKFRRKFSACVPTICWPRCFRKPLACQENISGDIEIPDHPLARETMKDALTEAMDVEGLKMVLADIAAGKHPLHCRGNARAVAIFA